MGYRSEGKLYLSDKAKKLLPNELRESLINDWTDEGDGVYAFYDWKWYSSYDDIKAWESFLSTLYDYTYEDGPLDDDPNYVQLSEDDWDITIVGEDGAIYEDALRTYSKFVTYTVIEVLN